MNSEPLHAEHGGQFFEAIGVDFGDLERRHQVINADVLDAWYNPSPKVVEAVREHLPWLLKTSPPTEGEGLVRAIAEVRNVPLENILIGAGSSSLMFLAMPRLVPAGGRMVVLDPTYGEYAHLAENVIGVQLVRFPLHAENGWQPDLDAFAQACHGANLAILVNPNTPTGTALPSGWIEELLARLGSETRLWVDETYIDFADPALSVERLVAKEPRLIVAKSMSKFYALSGVRMGYLALNADLRADLERLSPPWSVGLIAQVAALAALKDTGYYRDRAEETRHLASALFSSLSIVSGLRPFPTCANFLLAELLKGTAKEWAKSLEKANIFVRDCTSISKRFDGKFIRIAVKEASANRRVTEELKRVASQIS